MATLDGGGGGTTTQEQPKEEEQTQESSVQNEPHNVNQTGGSTSRFGEELGGDPAEGGGVDSGLPDHTIPGAGEFSDVQVTTTTDPETGETTTTAEATGSVDRGGVGSQTGFTESSPPGTTLDQPSEERSGTQTQDTGGPPSTVGPDQATDGRERLLRQVAARQEQLAERDEQLAEQFGFLARLLEQLGIRGFGQLRAQQVQAEEARAARAARGRRAGTPPGLARVGARPVQAPQGGAPAGTFASAAVQTARDNPGAAAVGVGAAVAALEATGLTNLTPFFL